MRHLERVPPSKGGFLTGFCICGDIWISRRRSMRHLEREENGRAMKAWVARGLVPLAQTRGVD